MTLVLGLVEVLIKLEIKMYLLSKEGKKSVLEVLIDECKVSDSMGPLLSALEKSASSLARCFEASTKGDTAAKAAKVLLLPEWPRSFSIQDD